MAKKQHLEILEQGVKAWNDWRGENPKVKPNLRAADLDGADLRGAQLSGADLRGARLWRARLDGAQLEGANLREAKLMQALLPGANLARADLSKASLDGAYLLEANLSGANLTGASLNRASLRLADLTDATLSGAFIADGANLTNARLTRARLDGAWLVDADLRWADLSGADLSGARLDAARLVETNLEGATLNGCSVYGISAWKLRLEGANQSNLRINNVNEPTITVDNLEVAQFIYLLLNNARIRAVLDTITSKVVLILGRFTPERKAVLEAIRDELRGQDYLPILFDFDVPKNLDVTETVTLLARMARFIIADLTEPSSIPHELESIVPTLAVPVQPLIQGADEPYSMFKDHWKYEWVLKLFRYGGPKELLASLREQVIDPAEAKARELASRRLEAGT